MEINELIEPEEWDDLPEDPAEAFARIIQLAKPRYMAKLAETADEYLQHDAAYGYMNALLGVGTSLGVQPFSTMEIPSPQNFDFQISREFESQLAFFMAKTQSDVAKRRRGQMVDVSARDRVTITVAAHRLREKVEKSDLPQWKKKKLIASLREFEKQLGTGRVNLTTITVTVVALMSAPGGLAQTYDWVTDVFEPILRPLVESKMEAEKTSVIPTILTPRIEGPPRSIASLPSAGKP
jgi:hypothetical protein